MNKSDLINYRATKKEIRQLSRRMAVAQLSIENSPELLQLYFDALSKLRRDVVRIEQAIAGLPSPVERMILRDRYINGFDWRHICCQLAGEGYSERQVYRLHGYALQHLKEVRPDVS